MTSLSQAELQRLLMVHAERLHRMVESKIPSDLKSVLFADDVVQDVCVAAHRARGSFRQENPDSFKTWLNTLVDRKLIDAMKAARALKRGGHTGTRSVNRDVFASYAGLLDQVASAQPTPSREVSAKEAVYAIQMALSSLPDDQRRAVQLRHIEGKTVEEIAVEMEKSVAAVGGLLHRGMLQLRAQFQNAEKYFTDGGETPEP